MVLATESPYLIKPKRQRVKKSPVENAVPAAAPQFSSYQEAFQSAMTTAYKGKQTVNGPAHFNGVHTGSLSVVAQPLQHGRMRFALHAPPPPQGEAAKHAPPVLQASSSVMARNMQLLRSYAPKHATGHHNERSGKPAAAAAVVLEPSRPHQAACMQQSGTTSGDCMGPVGQAGMPGAGLLQQAPAGLLLPGDGSSTAASPEPDISAAGTRLSCTLGDAVALSPATSQGGDSSRGHSQAGEGANAAGTCNRQGEAAAQSGAPRYRQADEALLQLWSMECLDAVRVRSARVHLRRLRQMVAAADPNMPITPRTAVRTNKSTGLGTTAHTWDPQSVLRSTAHKPRAGRGKPNRSADGCHASPSSAEPARACRSSSPTPPCQSTGMAEQARPVEDQPPAAAAAAATDVRQPAGSAPRPTSPHDLKLLLSRASAPHALTLPGAAGSPAGSVPALRRHNSVHALPAYQQALPGSDARRRQYHNRVLVNRGFVGGLDLPADEQYLLALAEDAGRDVVLPPPAQYRQRFQSCTALAPAPPSTPAPFLMGMPVEQLEQLAQREDGGLPSVSQVVASRIWHPAPGTLCKSGRHAPAHHFAGLMDTPRKQAFLEAYYEQQQQQQQQQQPQQQQQQQQVMPQRPRTHQQARQQQQQGGLPQRVDQHGVEQHLQRPNTSQALQGTQPRSTSQRQLLHQHHDASRAATPCPGVSSGAAADLQGDVDGRPSWAMQPHRCGSGWLPQAGPDPTHGVDASGGNRGADGAAASQVQQPRNSQLREEVQQHQLQLAWPAQQLQEEGPQDAASGSPAAQQPVQEEGLRPLTSQAVRGRPGRARDARQGTAASRPATAASTGGLQAGGGLNGGPAAAGLRAAAINRGWAACPAGLGLHACGDHPLLGSTPQRACLPSTRTRTARISSPELGGLSQQLHVHSGDGQQDEAGAATSAAAGGGELAWPDTAMHCSSVSDECQQVVDNTLVCGG